MFWDAANSWLGIGTNTYSANTRTTISENFTAQASIGLRVRGVGSSTDVWKGRIVAGGDSVAFLMGEYNSQAWLGGHNAALNAWAPLYLNPDGTTDLYLGDFGSGSSTVVVPIMTLRNLTGNILIGGTFTDSGERLQVTGNVKIVGGGATAGTNALMVQNSAASVAFYITNGLTTVVNGDLQLGNTVLYWSGGTQLRNISNGVLRITNSSNSDFTRLQFGGGTTSYPALQRSGSAICVTDATGTFVSNLLVGTTTDVASSKLTIDSTTQGFLPPRMTTTQKNAISSPAAGLVVYDTTLGKLCVYTTAWETITSA
jgi:hypothetical protein